MASDQALRDVVLRQVPVVRAAAAGAVPGNPDGIQRAYDTARDLEIALSVVGPTPGCSRLAAAARRYARAVVESVEQLDMLASPAAAQVRAQAALADLGGTGCSPRGGGRLPKPGSPGISPASGEVFFGTLVADAPAGGADVAEVRSRGVAVLRTGVRRGRIRVRLAGRPGRYDIQVVFSRGGRRVGERRADGVWLLPRAARIARPAGLADGAKARSLAAIGARAPFTVGLWTQDLATGRAAGWNDGARFPAASTVKLALMVAALARAGKNPQRSVYAYEVRQIGAFSSNLANNRLLRLLGGSEQGGAALAQATLARLEARSSTFTGGYIVGTELQPAIPTDGTRRSVPSVSGRVTTASDLGRILFAIHAAAVGDRAARRQTGLSTRAARLLVGYLLASRQTGDNRSLLAAGAPAGSLLAQKNGWIRAARHGAAIIYTPAGARIAVMMSYRESGMSLEAARGVGTQLAVVASR